MYTCEAHAGQCCAGKDLCAGCGGILPDKDNTMDRGVCDKCGASVCTLCFWQNACCAPE